MKELKQYLLENYGNYFDEHINKEVELRKPLASLLNKKQNTILSVKVITEIKHIKKGYSNYDYEDIPQEILKKIDEDLEEIESASQRDIYSRFGSCYEYKEYIETQKKIYDTCKENFDIFRGYVDYYKYYYEMPTSLKDEIKGVKEEFYKNLYNGRYKWN